MGLPNLPETSQCKSRVDLNGTLLFRRMQISVGFHFSVKSRIFLYKKKARRVYSKTGNA